MEIDGFYSQGIAYLSAFTAFSGPIKLESLYNQYEYYEVKKRVKRFQEEGIFLFGGKLNSGECLNSLIYIRIGCKPLQAKKVTAIVIS